MRLPVEEKSDSDGSNSYEEKSSGFASFFIFCFFKLILMETSAATSFAPSFVSSAFAFPSFFASIIAYLGSYFMRFYRFFLSSSFPFPFPFALAAPLFYFFCCFSGDTFADVIGVSNETVWFYWGYSTQSCSRAFFWWPPIGTSSQGWMIVAVSYSWSFFWLPRIGISSHGWATAVITFSRGVIAVVVIVVEVFPSPLTVFLFTLVGVFLVSTLDDFFLASSC